MSRLYIIEQSALAVGGHYYAYTQTVALAARKAGLDVTILFNRRFKGDWNVEGATAIPAFQHAWAESDQLWIREWRPGNIAYDFDQAVRTQPPRPGDHVLFATLGYAELLAVLDYIIQLPITDQLPTIHILLRYDPDFLTNDFDVFAPILDRIKRSAQVQRHVVFHTDTEILSAEFGSITGIKFSTLPIPFQQDHLKTRLTAGRSTESPLVITYLGDARLEKNYNDIPPAVASLWGEYIKTGRVRFVIQSNFNSEGGEPGIMQSVQKLGQYPPSAVELIETALNGEAYAERIAEADIIMVGYDPGRYKARSSGILIEAMAAGKPVVTTKGSWMESQVTADHAVVFEPGQLGSALKQAIDNFPKYKKGANSIASKVMSWSSGDNFVKALLTQVPETPANDENRPRILIVIDGDTLVQRNGAGVTCLTQLKYLQDAGYRTCAIFLMQKNGWDDERVAGWTDELRDRISPFYLERAFIVGSGRLSFNTLRRKWIEETPEHSITSDLYRIGAYDVSLDLTDYLSNYPIDAVWLNYITNKPLVEMLGLNNVPIICETHDIQSFQKAIYARRPISAEDVKQELRLLGQCAHLISVSAAETAYLAEMLPTASVTTTGMFAEPRKSAVRSLAGAKNLADVVSSCGPLLPQFSWEKAWEQAASEDVERLCDLETLDLVYVSSNHLANVSGLKWFLDQVYTPFLAPMGVSMAVAGSICEIGGWPQHNRLFFLGRLTYLEPLYAAARLVVLPILEGAGVAVKTYEALSNGRPVVATPLALRSLEAGTGGATIAETPRDFVASITRLLNSEADRTEQASAARASAVRQSDPSRYAQLLNDAFLKVLGDKAAPLHRAPSTFDATDVDVEWGELVIRVNRLVRSWLEAEPLLDYDLRVAARYPQRDLEPVLRTVLDTLLLERSAYLLLDRPRLRKLAALCTRADAEQAGDLILEAIKVCGGRISAFPPPKDVRFVFDNNVPLEIWVEGPSEAKLDEPYGPIRLQRRAETSWLRERIKPRPRPGTPAAVGKLSVSGSVAAAVISQPAQLDFSQGAPRGALIENRNEISVYLPTLFTSTAATRWLDLVFDQGENNEITVIFSGECLVCKEIQFNNVVILRYKLPSGGSGYHLFDQKVEIIGQAGLVRRCVLRLVVGTDPEAALKSVDHVEIVFEDYEPPIPRPSIQSMRPTARKLIQQLVTSVEDGTPMQRALAAVARNEFGADPAAFKSRLEEFLSAAQDVGTEATSSIGVADILPLIDAKAAIASNAKSGRYGFVASPALTFEIDVVFDTVADAEEAICLLDGQEASLIAAHECGRRWRFSGRNAAQSTTWVHEISFASDTSEVAPVPVWVDVVLTLPAMLDQTTGASSLLYTNVYEVEGDGAWRWTGPKSRSTLLLPFAVTGSGTAIIAISSAGGNVPDDVNVALNGVKLPKRIDRDDGSFSIMADFLGGDALASAEIELSVQRQISPPGDSRSLGVAIGHVEFRMRLETAKDCQNVEDGEV